MNAEIEENIRKKVKWSQLPTHIKQIMGNSSKEYDKYITIFSIRNQLRYRGNLVRHVCKNERRYYERIVAYSRDRLMLFPYHLADMIVKGLRITPFNYYISVVEKLIQAEKSYDTLPNFTAADCLRLLGIGRNEYIDLINKSRSNRGRLFGKKNVKILLPKVPCDIHIEPWWRVEIGLVYDDDIKMVNEEELAVIDRLIDLGSQSAGELNYQIVLSLYKKGLIYLDVPITSVDSVQVPPLQGFVMNRVTGDYFETLLYKIFVSIDEHITIGELANTVLQVDTELVKQAVSLYCRLQFARKLNPETEQEKVKRHLSWNQLPPDLNKQTAITPLTLNLNSESSSFQLTEELLSPDHELPGSPATQDKKGQRIAFLFDSALTAFLMMGNLSQGLKKHAVTMFEVGKLCDESLDSFLTELEKVSVLDADGEGEARRFFDHAVILRSTVLALRKLPSCGLDLIRLESLQTLDEATCSRLLQKKYRLLVSMAPLSREVRPVFSLSPPQLGPAVPEVNSLWFKFFIYHMTGYGPPSLLLVKGKTIKQLPRMFLGYSKLLVTTWLHEPAIIPISNIIHVNAALQYAPVLIQAYGVHQVASTRVVPFPFRPDTPIKGSCEINTDYQFRKHPASRILNEIIDIECNCGFLTFVNIGVLDFGCASRDRTVRLIPSSRKSSSAISGHSKIQRINQEELPEPLEPTCILNENFNFSNKSNDNVVVDTSNTQSEEECKLQSPDETHFANTPSNDSNCPSPANGFTSHECSKLLQEELDELDKKDDSLNKVLELRLSTTFSMEGLVTPSEEHVNMFSRETSSKDDISENEKVDEHKGEVWTLLDCHFGVPLFDANANTKICDTIVSGGLAEPCSLEKLVESSRKLGTMLLDFISQCQYYPGENMEIMKRGRLVPQPRYNLVFDNGKVTEWGGK
ncbi:hypothetical protein HHI36_012536 [Cryptolaemus montrouzieri]|uniref:Protein FAM91A1 n=1 Tax=Cryptolaemus montrouzieri TaxID=559131 RepID=A0ABD2NEJ2_9CUCU